MFNVKPNGGIVGGGGISRPVISWRMTDGSGTTVTDDSGNGNHGTLTNSGAWRSTVDGNGAFYLDDQAGVWRVDAAAGVFDNVPAFTVAYALGPDSFVDAAGYVFEKGLIQGNGKLIQSYNALQSMQVAIDYSTTNLQARSDGILAIPTGVDMFAVTWDGSNQHEDIRYYQEGTEIASKDNWNNARDGVGTVSDESAYPLRVGNRLDGARQLENLYGFWAWDSVLSEADRLAFEADPWGVAYA